MIPVICHNEYHIGDCLISCHLLRSLAERNPSRKFWFFLNANIAGEVAPAVEDIDNIELFTFESDQWREYGSRSVNMWKNRDDFWVRSKHRWDWSAFTLEHHQHIAGLLGLRSPFTHPSELLFDYPALNPNNIGGQYFYDALFINGEPHSGQFSPMSVHGSGYLDEIIQTVAKKHKVITTEPVAGVECTRDSKKSVTDIGRMSLLCQHHFMVATGPMWTTLNTTNNHHSAGRVRAVLLDNGEMLNMPGIRQCETRAELVPLLKEAGLL